MLERANVCSNLRKSGQLAGFIEESIECSKQYWRQRPRQAMPHLPEF